MNVPLATTRKVQRTAKYDVRPQNLLDSVHSPEPATIARDRKPRKVNTGKKRKFPHGHDNATREPGVPLEDRLAEFPGQGLVARGRSLKSRRHKTAWRRNSTRVVELDRIQKSILSHRVFRHRVQRALMLDGISREQFHTGELKQILEEQCALPRDHLDSVTSSIFEAELKQLHGGVRSVWHRGPVLEKWPYGTSIPHHERDRVWTASGFPHRGGLRSRWGICEE